MKSASKKFIALILAVVMMLSFTAVAFAADTDEVAFAYQQDPNNEDYNIITRVKTLVLEGDELTIPVNYREKDIVMDPELPESYSNIPISGVGEFAFTDMYSSSVYAALSKVKKIIVENGVTNIGLGAFKKLPALEEVVFLGDAVIDAEAFSGCEKLEKVTFTEGAQLGEYAFYGCKALKEIVANDTAAYAAPKSAFDGTPWYDAVDSDGELEKFVVLGSTLIAYRGNEANEVIPDGITTIGAEAFSGNHSLKSITISRDVTAIGDKAFATCTSLEKVNYSPEGEIESVGVDVFKNTPLFNNFDGDFFIIGNTLVKYTGDGDTFVAIPNIVYSIAPRAFDGAYTLDENGAPVFGIEAVLVPTSVTSLGDKCFVLGLDGDGNEVSPKEIYAYDDTSAMTALKEAGYGVVVMEYRKGDLDKNYTINAMDARLALRLAVGLDPTDISKTYAADIDGNGKVEASDARTLLRIAVGLEHYTIDSLHAIPTTKFEILNAYKTALANAQRENAGYTKSVSNVITTKNIGINSKEFSKLVLTGSKNSNEVVYEKGTTEALVNLPIAELDNTDFIRMARCDAKNGKYTIKIALYDYADCDITAIAPDYTETTSYIGKLIPMVSGKSFYDVFSAQDWFEFKADKYAAKQLNEYALTYTEPTIIAVIDVGSGAPAEYKLESVKLSVNYRFTLKGSNGLLLPIPFDNVIERSDVVTFGDFK